MAKKNNSNNAAFRLRRVCGWHNDWGCQLSAESESTIGTAAIKRSAKILESMPGIPEPSFAQDSHKGTHTDSELRAVAKIICEVVICTLAQKPNSTLTNSTKITTCRVCFEHFPDPSELIIYFIKTKNQESTS